jgi:hypothetical protein
MNVQPGSPRRLTVLNVSNGIHTELFSEPREHLKTYLEASRSMHASLAAEVARRIEAAAHANRRIADRYLCLEAVRLLEHGATLRTIGRLLALDKLPKREDPRQPDAAWEQYVVTVPRGGVDVEIVVGDTRDKLGAVVEALTGADSDYVRPALDQLWASEWKELVTSHQGDREAARRARDEKVRQLTFEASPQFNGDPKDVELCAQMLGTGHVEL